ncbi:unnamed protein product, partial [Polarella glacialis]
PLVLRPGDLFVDEYVANVVAACVSADVDDVAVSADGNWRCPALGSHAASKSKGSSAEALVASQETFDLDASPSPPAHRAPPPAPAPPPSVRTERPLLATKPFGSSSGSGSRSWTEAVASTAGFHLAVAMSVIGSPLRLGSSSSSSPASAAATAKRSASDPGAEEPPSKFRKELPKPAQAATPARSPARSSPSLALAGAAAGTVHIDLD